MQGKTTDIGTDPNLGADFPYSVVACGEPRDLWRLSASFLKAEMAGIVTE